MVTAAKVDDTEEAGRLLMPVDREVASEAADGIFDKWKVCRVVEPRAARILIPPRSNARIWRHCSAFGPPLARDANLRRMHRVGHRADEPIGTGGRRLHPRQIRQISI